VTRRILLVLLAFTAVVIAAAMVPLGLNTIGHDRSSFTQATAATARTDAAVAQARLDVIAQGASAASAPADAPLLSVLGQVRQAGDGLLILESDGKILTNQNMPSGNWIKLAKYADAQARSAGQAHQPQPLTETVGSRVVAVAPVYQRGIAGPVVGTVILARSADPLNRDILALWLILGTIAAVALLGATLLAFALARWVSRPLAGLDSAAGRLADGDLAIRAVVGSGPPELRRLATTFNTMAGRLEALVHGNRAVIADVSHQLRTPLAALRLRLDLLAADTVQSDPATGHELAGALEELARLSRLVDGLLAVARAENVVPVPAAVDVAEVASERVVAWHPVADDRGIVLEVREGRRLLEVREGRRLEGREGGRGGGLGAVGRGTALTGGMLTGGMLTGGMLTGGKLTGSGSSPGGPALAWIGEGHLEQILDNLIANALEALGAGNQVTVTTAATASGAQIIVSDNGPGMNAEDRERAFLRFTTSNPNGTGLGLAIVHRLVTSNGGTAGLTETPGGGLTITLNFPGVPAANGSGPASDGASATPDAITV
jgi:signal transduction histidine kinase